MFKSNNKKIIGVICILYYSTDVHCDSNILSCSVFHGNRTCRTCTQMIDGLPLTEL
jgi:hypothetical protein